MYENLIDSDGSECMLLELYENNDKSYTVYLQCYEYVALNATYETKNQAIAHFRVLQDAVIRNLDVEWTSEMAIE